MAGWWRAHPLLLRSAQDTQQERCCPVAALDQTRARALLRVFIPAFASLLCSALLCSGVDMQHSFSPLLSVLHPSASSSLLSLSPSHHHPSILPPLFFNVIPDLAHLLRGH